MLNRLKIIEMSRGIVDLKVRSKIYRSFSEAVQASHTDFHSKMSFLYEKEKQQVESTTVMNPTFMGNSVALLEVAATYGPQATVWDENCCAAIFMSEKRFVEDQPREEENELPPTMMFKYEVMFTEDAIELTRNGDFVISPANIPSHNYNSTYH